MLDLLSDVFDLSFSTTPQHLHPAVPHSVWVVMTTRRPKVAFVTSDHRSGKVRSNEKAETGEVLKDLEKFFFFLFFFFHFGHHIGNWTIQPLTSQVFRCRWSSYEWPDPIFTGPAEGYFFGYLDHKTIETQHFLAQLGANLEEFEMNDIQSAFQFGYHFSRAALENQRWGSKSMVPVFSSWKELAHSSSFLSTATLKAQRTSHRTEKNIPNLN